MKRQLVFFTLFMVVLSFSPVRAQEDCKSLNDSLELYTKTQQFPEAEKISERILSVCEKDVGREHLDYAGALNNVAQILMYRKGDYPNALRMLLKADSIFVKNGATATKDYGALKGTIGGAFLYFGDYAQAEKACREALGIAIATSDSTNLGNRHNSLGVVLFQQGKYDEASAHIDTALSMLERQYSKAGYLYLVSALNYAVMLYNVGKYEPEYRIMKSIFPAADAVFANHPYRGMFWVMWGHANLMTGRHADALRILEQARQIQLNVFGNQHFEYGRALGVLAMTLRQIGQYSKALPMQEEAVNLLKKSAGPLNQATLTSVGNLIILYVETGEIEKAFTLYEQILRDIKSQFGVKHLDYLTQQSNYSSFLHETGFVQKAEAETNEAEKNYRAAFDTLSVNYGRILGNLGVLYAEKKQLDSAVMFQTRALRIFENAAGKETLEYASALHGLSYDFQQMGKLDTTIGLAKQAMEILRKNGMGDTPLAARILMSLVEVSCSRHEYAIAMGYVAEALSVVEKSTGLSSRDYPVIIGRKGRVHEFAGQIPEAFASFRESVLLSRERISQVAGIYSYGGEEAFALQVQPVFENFAGFAHRHSEYRKESAGILYDNALALDFLLLQQTRSAIEAARSSGDPLLAAQVREWNDLKQLWAFQSNLPAGKRQYKLDSLSGEIERLERRMTASFLPLKQARDRVSWQNVQSALAPDEAAIQFINFPADEPTGSEIVYYALLLRPGYERPKMVYLCREAELEALFDQKPGSEKGMINRLYPYSAEEWRGKEQYSRLYSLLWEPVKKHLRGTRRIYYAPSGQLYRIAFPAIVKKPGDILADHFDLQYVASTRDLVWRGDSLRGSDIHTAQVFGGIIYATDSLAMVRASERSEPGFLPATLREMRWVDSLLRAHGIQSDTFSGYRAGEGRIKRFCTDTLRSPDLLHIGTHGYYFPVPAKKPATGRSGYKWADNPMFRSYLLMAGGLNAHTGEPPVGGFDDGLLSAYEIASLNLTGTRLVVLSACETGLGDLRNNEGVYGLQRAFKIAGVRHMLVSLWKVGDTPTEVFMRQFYRYWIAEGRDIRVAFRQAQEWMRQQNDYRDPYFWAGFVLI